MFFPQFKIFIVCQTEDSQQQMSMSEIASKKKRNEFLIYSAEKSIGYSTVFLSFYSIPIYSRQSGFFLFFFFFF